MATFTVTCRGDLGRGVVTQLTNAGVYRHDEAEPGSEGDGMRRHFLEIEAGSPDDAVLVAKGAMAVAGGSARDYQAYEGPPPGAPDWSPAVRPLPYENPGAKVVFYILVGVWVASELRARFRARGNQRGATREWGSFVAVVACFYLGLVGGFLFATKVESAAIEFARWPIFIVGAVLTAAGVAFRQWAIAVLGAWFTVEVRVSEGQTVVESGPYRWVAHPAYTGLIAIFVGIGLMLGNWLSLACLAIVPTAGLAVRIKVEERAMLTGIGEPYRHFSPVGHGSSPGSGESRARYRRD